MFEALPTLGSQYDVCAEAQRHSETTQTKGETVSNEVKQEAPERIWINNPAEITEHDQRWWYENAMAFPTIEYVRADLLATVRRAEREAALRDAVTALRSHQESVRDRHYGVLTLAIEAVQALQTSANHKGE